jgi:hypothetical protein
LKFRLDGGTEHIQQLLQVSLGDAVSSTHAISHDSDAWGLAKGLLDEIVFLDHGHPVLLSSPQYVTILPCTCNAGAEPHLAPLYDFASSQWKNDCPNFHKKRRDSAMQFAFDRCCNDVLADSDEPSFQDDKSSWLLRAHAPGTARRSGHMWDSAHEICVSLMPVIKVMLGSQEAGCINASPIASISHIFFPLLGSQVESATIIFHLIAFWLVTLQLDADERFILSSKTLGFVLPPMDTSRKTFLVQTHGKFLDFFLNHSSFSVLASQILSLTDTLSSGLDSFVEIF